MNYFLDTVDTIPEGMGFSLFKSLHLCCLAAFVLIVLACSVWYCRLETNARVRWRKTLAVLLLMDELFKMVILFAGGNYDWTYLPLHLCSINIFFITWHAWRPSKLLGNFLYTVCIPGAVAALLFPSWTELPLWNGMHLHSLTVHILLALYPIALTAGGDIRPDWRKLPQCLGFLVLLAVVIYGVNLLLDTNFMFLMYAEEGNPLCWFEQYWGSHLLGFPVIIAGVLIVMHVPMVLYNKLKKR